MKIPKHVAIIMDGNGRWAQTRSHSRIWGHIRGASIVSKIVEESDSLGVKALTMFAFSTENWSRPRNEITTLFKLLRKFLVKERKRILSNGIKFRVFGDISNLPEDTKALIQDLEVDSALNKGLKLNFAFGYGSRKEILNAVNRHVLLNPGIAMTEEDMSKQLFTSDCGDVDLLIRTGGEKRISNFLLWQMSYAELCFLDESWPNFSVTKYRGIIEGFSQRERRFGNITSADSIDESILLAQRNQLSFQGAHGNVEH